jgi:NAD(P)-dependent dehydrogenase (short-subunit alcohol dehydrogenase family)
VPLPLRSEINIMANKIAIVTGGSRGLGKDMALRLASNGVDVILTYQSQKDAANEVVTQIENTGAKGVALKFDSSIISSINDFVKEVKGVLETKWNCGTFDFLVNNAGVGATIPYMQATESDFDRFMNIHFKSVYFLTQRLLPLMNDGGSIVNISTGTTRFANPGYSIYASMKGAIEVFTRYLAKEVGPRGIRANVLAPGPIETDFNNAFIRNNPDRKKMMANNTALGRVGEASDIGGIVGFLCSDDSRWVTGQRLEASGGINL